MSFLSTLRYRFTMSLCRIFLAPETGWFNQNALVRPPKNHQTERKDPVNSYSWETVGYLDPLVHLAIHTNTLLPACIPDIPFLFVHPIVHMLPLLLDCRTEHDLLLMCSPNVNEKRSRCTYCWLLIQAVNKISAYLDFFIHSSVYYSTATTHVLPSKPLRGLYLVFRLGWYPCVKMIAVSSFLSANVPKYRCCNGDTERIQTNKINCSLSKLQSTFF